MLNIMGNEKDGEAETEAGYEAVAGQEEIYIEETEEEVREVLISMEPSASEKPSSMPPEDCEERERDWKSMTDVSDDPA